MLEAVVVPFSAFVVFLVYAWFVLNRHVREAGAMKAEASLRSVEARQHVERAAQLKREFEALSAEARQARGSC